MSYYSYLTCATCRDKPYANGKCEYHYKKA